MTWQQHEGEGSRRDGPVTTGMVIGSERSERTDAMASRQGLQRDDHLLPRRSQRLYEQFNYVLLLILCLDFSLLSWCFLQVILTKQLAAEICRGEKTDTVTAQPTQLAGGKRFNLSSFRLSNAYSCCHICSYLSPLHSGSEL